MSLTMLKPIYKHYTFIAYAQLLCLYYYFDLSNEKNNGNDLYKK